MERTSENSSFIQLEGMHYLSFFLACQMHESSRRRRRTRNTRTPTNAHAFCFFISRQMHARCRSCNMQQMHAAAAQQRREQSLSLLLSLT